MRGKTLQTRIFYPARLSFRCEDDRNNFIDKENKKEFSTTKPELQEVVKELL